MIAWLSDTHNWIALFEIIGVNIILSGDNAVVIALACRTLPSSQQRLAIFFGAAGAIVLRALLTVFAALLLARPYLKLAGGALLFWIAIKLLLPDDDGDGETQGNAGIYSAIKTIVIADLVMSLDNVLGVAAVAKGDVILLIMGLLISMPLIIYGSTLIMGLMGRFPVLIALGAGLLGYVAGEMMVSDPAAAPWLEAHASWVHLSVPPLGAVLVVFGGKYFAHRKKRALVEVSVEQQESKL